MGMENVKSFASQRPQRVITIIVHMENVHGVRELGKNCLNYVLFARGQEIVDFVLDLEDVKFAMEEGK
ncbi:MAG: hypothetical protein JSW00_10810 [Thermoplasmata archaeon]|nr:MAG: hypothetical protein JSW00_10810 [Thermoplasmata archaeon]